MERYTSEIWNWVVVHILEDKVIFLAIVEVSNTYSVSSNV